MGWLRMLVLPGMLIGAAAWMARRPRPLPLPPGPRRAPEPPIFLPPLAARVRGRDASAATAATAARPDIGTHGAE